MSGHLIKLDYKIDPGWRPYEIDLRSADELTMRYDAFPGDVVFRVEGEDFSAQWGWVPVLDFALALRTIARRLAEHEHELFEFTESGATIDFRRNGDDRVVIAPSYAQGTAAVALRDFSEATERFVETVCAQLRDRHPELAGNASFAELR